MYEVSWFGPVARIRLGRSILGRVLMWANVFWVDGLLIDTGLAHGTPELMQALEREGLQVEQVVATHTHKDHVAGNAALHRRYGVIPRVHPLGLPMLQQPMTAREMPAYRRLIWGVVEPSPAAPLGDWVETHRYRFRVIHTPGHAPDHVVFLAEREGWLFSGDLLISPRLATVKKDEEPLQILDSMRQVVNLPINKIFCGHSYKVWEGAEPFQEKIHRWEELAAKARRLRAQGWSPGRIARRLLGRPGLPELISMGEFHRLHLVAGLLQGDAGR